MARPVTRLRTPLRLASHCRSMILSATLSAFVTAFAAPVIAAAEAKASTPVQSQQRFATPQAASEALVTAVRANDPKRIRAVLGPGSDQLINSGDPVAD